LHRIKADSLSIDIMEVGRRAQTPEAAAGDEERGDQRGAIEDEREVGERNRVRARDAIASSGFDAIAFFAPIHFFGYKRWGIYIDEEVFFGACAEVAAFLDIADWASIVADMLRGIRRHEPFHSSVELFALVLEDFSRLGASVEKCPYDLHARNDYRKSWPGADCLEERIATAVQFRCRFKTPGFREVMARMLNSAPPAYAGWSTCETPQALDESIQALGLKIIEAAYSGQVFIWYLRTIADDRLPRPRLWFPEYTTRSLESKGPLPWWAHRTGGVRTGRFSRALLANVRLTDLLNALQRVYNAQIVSGGKHAAVVFPNGRKVPFPARRAVPAYLIGDIAKALGVTRKEVLSTCLGVNV
jgi:hypothetical protein